MNRSIRFFVLFFIGLLDFQSGYAQRNATALRLQKNTKGFYLEHKVSAKQSLFSLGRLYNVHPRHLADFNNIDPNKGLQLDQVIRIPLTDTNFQRVKGQGVPITLLASTDDVISDMARFAGIQVKDMQCWNNFTGTEIKKGTTWIVGFLQTNEMSGQQVNLPCPAATVPAPNPPAPPSPTTVPLPPATGSYFEPAFQEQVKKTPISQQLKLIASTFQTQSGWTDLKYYVVIDNLVTGTIVRLTNPVNKMEVYAKVLGEMAPIKQNEGLDIRISDAAAALLELPANGKFSIEIAY